MSKGTSAIVNLFIAIYGHPPSSQTTEALIRAEQVLGIAEGDALARFYVVLLHSADRIDAAIDRRHTDENAFTTKLRDVASNLTTIVNNVEHASHTVMRTAKRRGSMLSDDDLVAVSRSASPLFTYLRHAFYFTSLGEEDAERIMAARHDIFATIILLFIMILATWFVFINFPM